jgi:hypothetical protein
LERSLKEGLGPSQAVVFARNAAKEEGKIGPISAFLRAKKGDRKAGVES